MPYIFGSFNLIKKHLKKYRLKYYLFLWILKKRRHQNLILQNFL